MDITAHCQWLVSQGRMPQVRIDKISLGFEISQSAGGENYTCNSYSLWTWKEIRRPGPVRGPAVRRLRRGSGTRCLKVH
jgi:hypothetical protein